MFVLYYSRFNWYVIVHFSLKNSTCYIDIIFLLSCTYYKMIWYGDAGSSLSNVHQRFPKLNWHIPRKVSAGRRPHSYRSRTFVRLPSPRFQRLCSPFESDHTWSRWNRIAKWWLMGHSPSSCKWKQSDIVKFVLA